MFCSARMYFLIIHCGAPCSWPFPLRPLCPYLRRQVSCAKSSYGWSASKPWARCGLLHAEYKSVNSGQARSAGRSLCWRLSCWAMMAAIVGSPRRPQALVVANPATTRRSGRPLQLAATVNPLCITPAHASWRTWLWPALQNRNQRTVCMQACTTWSSIYLSAGSHSNVSFALFGWFVTPSDQANRQNLPGPVCIRCVLLANPTLPPQPDTPT